MRKLSAIITIALLSSSAGRVFAAPHAADAVGAAAHHDGGGSGLPQLDPANFTSQIFWILVAFGVLYVFFSRRTLPEISSVLESRHAHIQSDLTSAEELQQEAEEVQEAYEKILADARAKAARSFAQAEEKISAKMVKEYQGFQERSANAIAEKEAAIEKAKSEAIEQMNGLAAEIAREAAEKIIGVETDLKQAKTVVKSLHSARAKAA